MSSLPPARVASIQHSCRRLCAAMTISGFSVRSLVTNGGSNFDIFDPTVCSKVVTSLDALAS